MKFYTALFVFLFGLTLPTIASAAVLINEIAWMGSAESSTNEWIELMNTGSTVIDVSGWTLVAEDGTPDISLSGSITPGGYYLIERTDDTTVSNVPADLVVSFGSGLSNGGETLRLKDAEGNVIDTVIAGANWVSVGGDNTTKETAQRAGSGWVTAQGTPRTANGNEETSATSSSSSPSPTSTQIVTTNGKTHVSPYPRSNLTLEAKERSPLFVGFPLEFSGHALGLYDESLPYATYRWNWGDGSTGIGATTTHTYMHAGEYVVTLEAVNGSLRNSVRLNIVVTPPEITIEKVLPGVNGAVFLRNGSLREIDLSGWKLSEEGSGAFVIPEHTIVLPGKLLVLGNAITLLGEREGDIILAYPNGTQATRIESLPLQMNATSTQVVSSFVSPPKNQKVSLRAVQEELPQTGSSSIVGATVLWDGGRNGEVPVSASASWKWWILACGAVLLVLVGVVMFRSVPEPQLAREYAIIEEIEGKDDL